jgi:hypothetical protein
MESSENVDPELPQGDNIKNIFEGTGFVASHWKSLTGFAKPSKPTELEATVFLFNESS